MLTSDAEKADALSAVFFPEPPPSRFASQHSIDFTWSTHHPPGAPAEVGVSPHEVISAVRRMRVGAAPSIDGIPHRVFKKYLFTLLP